MGLGPTRPPLEATDLGEYLELDKEECRQALVLDLARGEGVLAVVLVSVHGREYRPGAHNDSVVNLLATVDRLLDRKGSYRVFYTVFREAQLVLRPLDRGYLAVLTRNKTNLGQLLYRMSRIEATQVGGSCTSSNTCYRKGAKR
jgi:predicted regulator of Ras-like GTPase activity (Roadblock/LC7/MglB family)